MAGHFGATAGRPYRHWLGQWADILEIPEDKAEFASFTDSTTQDQLRSIIRTSAQEPGAGHQRRADRRAVNAFHGHRRDPAGGAGADRKTCSAVDALDSVDELPGPLGRLEREGVGSPLAGRASGQPRFDPLRAGHVAERAPERPDRDYYLEESFAATRSATPITSPPCWNGSVSVPPPMPSGSWRWKPDWPRSHWTTVANRDPVKT